MNTDFAKWRSGFRHEVNDRCWRISLKKAAFGNWHEGAALIHSGR